jgi:hypothetical protein
LHLSMRMICPVNTRAGYWAKLATMTAMKNAFDNHNNSGGLYGVVTPSYIFHDLVMVGMRDVGTQQTKQVQVEWQIDFMKPLVTLTDASSAYNSAMKQIDSGVQTNGATSGPAASVGPAVWDTAGGAYYGPPGIGSDTVATINQAAGISANTGPPINFPGQP